MATLNVLIAGRSGQVAQALLETAPLGLVNVTALGRPGLDLADADSIDAVVDAAAPHLVINAAAYTAVDQAETDEAAATAVNAHGPARLAAAAARHGAAFFHLSTDYVFSGEKLAPYVETDPTGPVGAYGRSKLAGEIAVAAACPAAYVFRTAWVYSPGGRNFLTTMLRLATSRSEISVVDDQFGNPTSAHDIAAGLWKAALQIARAPSSAPPGLYHIAGTGEASWAAFAEHIFEVSASLGGPAARVIPIPAADYPSPARRPANSRLDTSKLAASFGVFSPHWQASTLACLQQIKTKEGWGA